MPRDAAERKSLERDEGVADCDLAAAGDVGPEAAAVA